MLVCNWCGLQLSLEREKKQRDRRYVCRCLEAIPGYRRHVIADRVGVSLHPVVGCILEDMRDNDCRVGRRV